jgi:hypothetical protein
MLNKQVKIQKIEKRLCAYLEIKDAEFPPTGTLELWIREVKPYKYKATKEKV